MMTETLDLVRVLYAADTKNRVLETVRLDTNIATRNRGMWSLIADFLS